MLQPKDHERLRLFEARELALGSMFLRTPVLRRVGESLRLVLLHPVSDEEFPLLAQVVRVSDGESGTEPKGMVLDFEALDYTQRAAFHDFVEQGRGVVTEPPPSVVDAVRGLPDEPLGQHPALIEEPRTRAAEPAPRFPESREPAPSPEPEAPASFAATNGANGVQTAASVEPPPPPSSLPEPIGGSAVSPPAPAFTRTPPAPVAAPVFANPHAGSPAHAGPRGRCAHAGAGDRATAASRPGAGPHSGSRLLGPQRTAPSLPETHGELRAALMAKPDDVSLLFRLGSALAREPRNAAEAVALLTWCAGAPSLPARARPRCACQGLHPALATHRCQTAHVAPASSGSGHRPDAGADGLVIAG